MIPKNEGKNEFELFNLIGWERFWKVLCLRRSIFQDHDGFLWCTPETNLGAVQINRCSGSPTAFSNSKNDFNKKGELKHFSIKVTDFCIDPANLCF